MLKKIDVQEFINSEKEGIIYCKISKSPGYGGKGSNIDYAKKTGEFLVSDIGNMTFEPLEIVLNYLHYGDRLTIIEFKEKDFEQLKESKIVEDIRNPGCYNTTKYKAGVSMSLRENETYDYIFENAKDSELFKATLINNYKQIVGTIEDDYEAKETAKYFRKKVSQLFQNELIPDDLVLAFNTEYIGGQGLYDLLIKLSEKRVNIYIKDRMLDTFSKIEKELIESVEEEIHLNDRKGNRREFYVCTKDLPKVENIKNKIFNNKDGIFSRLIGKFLK